MHGQNHIKFQILLYLTAFAAATISCMFGLQPVLHLLKAAITNSVTGYVSEVLQSNPHCPLIFFNLRS